MYIPANAGRPICHLKSYGDEICNNDSTRRSKTRVVLTSSRGAVSAKITKKFERYVIAISFQRILVYYGSLMKTMKFTSGLFDPLTVYQIKTF